MNNLLRIAVVLAVPLELAARQANGKRFPDFEFTGKLLPPDPPVIRQPVLPEMLVPCRGHVLVPALGMPLVPKNMPAPGDDQYLREERITPPYRIIPPDARLSMDQSPARLNVELDRLNRAVGLYCG